MLAVVGCASLDELVRQTVPETIRLEAPLRLGGEGTRPLGEREVLELMAQGRTNIAIGRLMVITQGAVEKHISSIFTKLGLPPSSDDHRRVMAVLAWLG